MFCVYAILALGLTVQYGLTGLINFGHVAFFAIGAYATAIAARFGLGEWLVLILAIVLPALAIVPLGWLTLRLKEDYLALATIGFAEAIRLGIEHESWLTRGPSGIGGIPQFIEGLTADVSDLATLAICIASVILALVFLNRLTTSPYGRTLRAIRDNEVAVATLGKSVVSYKFQSLLIGAALAGLAGFLYARYLTFISPEQFDASVTFYVWIAIVIGGYRRLSGALAGTALLIAFLEGTRFMSDLDLGVAQDRIAAMRFVLVGLGLIIVLRFRPQGLVGGQGDA
jgi:branched-chain amino acid transport system permease protein